MRRSLASSLALGSLGVLALSGCGGGGGCIIDSDCADFTMVCIQQQCVPAGTVPDAGRRDAGVRPDGGVRQDAGPDSGTALDAGTSVDSGAAACADVTGAWSVGTILAAPCGSAATGYGLTIAAGASACELTATSNDPVSAPAIDGTFTLAADGNLTGTLSPGNAGPTSCTGSLSGSTLTFVCGSCVIQVTR